MRLGSTLLFLGVLALPAYFVLFYRTFRKYEDDGRKYAEAFGESKWRNIALGFLVVGAFISPNAVVAVALMVAALIWMAIETMSQNRRMSRLDVSDKFSLRLRLVSLLSPVAILCLFGSKLWFQANLT